MILCLFGYFSQNNVCQALFRLYLCALEPFVGYDGTGNEWDDYSRYVNDGVEMPSVSCALSLVIFLASL